MNRSSDFFIAFAAAALTFGALNLVVGPKPMGWRGHYPHAHRDYHDSHYRDNKKNKEYHDKENKSEDPDNDPSQKIFNLIH